MSKTYDPIAIEALRETLGITDLYAGNIIFQILQAGEAVTAESIKKAKASVSVSVSVQKNVKPETAIEATSRILRQKYGS
ncbi:hypothetical protein LRS56_19770 [Pseudomonas poae]|nr:hypothetical protein LRS56_19770 [Pseudomonas poae]